MKTKKLFIAITLLACAFAPRIMAMSARQPTVTLLVAPARYTIIQIANDIIAKRPAVLASYSNGMDGPQLHVWDGAQWIPVTLDDYAKTAFMRRKPGRIVVIKDTEMGDVESILAASSWCARVETIDVLQTAPLLNRLGKVFKFSPSEWHWFADRYNCELEILNKEELEKSWYDQKRNEFLEREKKMKGISESESDAEQDVPDIDVEEMAPTPPEAEVIEEEIEIEDADEVTMPAPEMDADEEIDVEVEITEDELESDEPVEEEIEQDAAQENEEEENAGE